MLRGRLEGGQRNKARRGEFFTHAPIGYVRAPDGGLALEPDEQARAVVALIFAKFAELGSVAAVLRYLKRQQIQVGVRDHRGPEAGRLKWRPPNCATLQGMIQHPIYAGAYTYGRRHTNPRKRVAGRPGSGRAWGKPEDWLVLLHDLLPSYISWEQYEANRRQLRDNSSKFGRGRPAREAHCWVGCSPVGVVADEWQPVMSPGANPGSPVTARVTTSAVRSAKH